MHHHTFRSLALASVAAFALAACGSDTGSGPAASGRNVQPAGSSACAGGNMESSGKRWLSAWGVTRVEGTAPVDTTVRNIAKVTTAGQSIRVRFINLSDQPMEIGAAAVGFRDGAVGANLKPNSNKALTFNCGQTSAVIPPQTESFYSDALAFPVNSQDELAISLYVKGANNPGEFGATWVESYKLPDGSGNQVLEASGAGYGLIDGQRFSTPPGLPLVCNGCTVYAVRDVEVLTSQANGAMVFLGSSSFHGYNTTQNQYRRVGDLLSQRMDAEIPAGQRNTIVNRGIGGDTLFAATESRLVRDVFNTVGVSSVVVWVTNDLSSKTADEIIANYRDVIAQASARNIKVYCPTWLPGAQSTQANVRGERAKLNDWILNSGECQGVADYNAAVEAPGGLTFLPQYNSGDSIHSNDAGHALWAEITPLADWVSPAKR
ncbi:GDSL-type esterase/lipase family protein [Limnobacter sp.]|uniref:GDSL-type esterase/lipase family protein n=1 Tax=Limnobacter sp. TaxID=2003368 RepID=UPI003517E2E3